MGVSGLAAVELVSYTYDSLGRMSAQSFHNGGYNSSYAYNVRGWLTGINNNKFSQTLGYGSHYNGNISTMNWTANGSSHSYAFTYDDVNRMLNATHGTGAYTEKVTGYDKNGNIAGLQRYGNGLIDNLTYTYNGNRLTKVEDATGNTAGFKNGASQENEYTYDANGNLTKDSNKGIASITYNSLNLPQQIQYTNGFVVNYGYSADGVKQRVQHPNSGLPDVVYCGNVIYEGGAQKFLLTEEGYVDLSASTPVYYYYLKDHQGNNRVVINSSGAVVETNHYYPFGSTFASSSVQPYKYNGKELDTANGLNWYDYGARHYDAVLGRFTTQDRFAEKYSALSPYQYGANSPVCNVDVNGDSIQIMIPTEIEGNWVNVAYNYQVDSNGNYGFYDASGNMYSGSNDFVSKLTLALDALRNGKVGNKLVANLMNSTKVVQIAKSSKNRASSKGDYILWNAIGNVGGIDQSGGTNRPSFIGLGHEMAHIQDVWNGTYDSNVWANGIPNAEKYSTHIENQLRAEHNLPLRTHYGIKNGKGDPATPLLIPKTSASLFYKRAVLLEKYIIPTPYPYVYK